MVKNQLVNKAIDYIMDNLDEKISIDDVAKHCNTSKFHFSRVFKKETNESLYSFIKRLKMEKSALRIKAERNRPITDIGYDFGYSPSNYSSAFKDYHRATPIQFRAENDKNYIYNPFYQNKKYFLESFEYYDKNIEVKEIEDLRVIFERTIGNYIDLDSKWCRFIKRYEKYMDEETLLIERSYDDPTVTKVDQCLYDICMTVDENCELENITTIKGGKFLVYHFEDRVENIFLNFQGLFGVWFPKSGYEIDERHGFEIYRKIHESEMKFTMDFFIPIK